MVENDAFRSYLKSVKMTAKMQDRRALLTEMRRIRAKLEPKLAALLKGQHLVVTRDGWTDKSTLTYRSTTYTFIDEHWELTAISPYCEKHGGSTTGDELAKFIEGAMMKHRQVGHVTAVVTDCEPSMVKAGRLLEAKKLTTHIGCAGHRLQSSAGFFPLVTK